MPIAESDVKWVDEPRLGLWEQLYLPAMVDGLKTTVTHIFSKKITEQYPEQEPKLPANYRGVHRLNRDEAGPREVRRLLHVRDRLPGPLHRHRRRARAAEWKDREKYPETFVIDELRCIYCGMCEEACPVDAIELTTLYDLTGLQPRADDVRQGEAAERVRRDDEGRDRPGPHAGRQARTGV